MSRLWMARASASAARPRRALCGGGGGVASAIRLGADRLPRASAALNNIEKSEDVVIPNF